MAQTILQTSVSITPKADDLLRNSQVHCHIAGCASVFKNSGNLRMHLEKHHKLPVISAKDGAQKLFFCPQADCVYHENSSSQKHFKSLKYLRQHFQKVHAEKCYNCTKCGKGFGTESMRNSHSKNCGNHYTCPECSWSYYTSEALQTHAKRRGHQLKRKCDENPAKVAIPRLEKQAVVLPEVKSCETQTENKSAAIPLPPKKRYSPEINHFNETLLCDIETQTELNLNPGLLDRIMSHMWTQTCDDFLSELADIQNLTDIQTQTNWIDDEEEHPRQRPEQFSSGAHDELMVSTETQTSFTQYLLDSCNEENSLTGCITQQTQTCGPLLEGLFGGEDNDFIGSFQSTYTQT